VGQTSVELGDDLVRTLALIAQTALSSLRFRDTWLRCPRCGQEEQFSFIAPAAKYIRQYPDTRERSEGALTFLDYSEEDTVECGRCGHVDPYGEFVADA
jgi:ribosomal protein S27AE